MIKYNSYKIFQNKTGEQYLYLVNNNSIFALDDKAEKMLSLDDLDVKFSITPTKRSKYSFF